MVAAAAVVARPRITSVGATILAGSRVTLSDGCGLAVCWTFAVMKSALENALGSGVGVEGATIGTVIGYAVPDLVRAFSAFGVPATTAFFASWFAVSLVTPTEFSPTVFSFIAFAPHETLVALGCWGFALKLARG